MESCARVAGQSTHHMSKRVHACGHSQRLVSSTEGGAQDLRTVGKEDRTQLRVGRAPHCSAHATSRTGAQQAELGQGTARGAGAAPPASISSSSSGSSSFISPSASEYLAMASSYLPARCRQPQRCRESASRRNRRRARAGSTAGPTRRRPRGARGRPARGVRGGKGERAGSMRAACMRAGGRAGGMRRKGGRVRGGGRRALGLLVQLRGRCLDLLYRHASPSRDGPSSWLFYVTANNSQCTAKSYR